MKSKSEKMPPLGMRIVHECPFKKAADKKHTCMGSALNTFIPPQDEKDKRAYTLGAASRTTNLSGMSQYLVLCGSLGPREVSEMMTCGLYQPWPTSQPYHLGHMLPLEFIEKT